MAENVPTPPGAPVPPKPAELPKPQAKKETVRINLPPKPTASTIKLPNLPPPGASAAPVAAAAPVSAAAPVAAAPAAPVGVPKPPSPPGAGGAGTRVAAHTPSAPPPTPAPVTPAKAPARSSLGSTQVSGLDKALAVGAAVFSLAALGVVIYLWMFLTNTGGAPGVTE